uniref:M14 family zinc carboxypeptidase n=1 Tax=Gelidibacter sp. TaxID=2018083 RepID=UPI00404B5F06
MTSETLQTLFKNHKENHLYHRYVALEHIQLLLEKHQPYFNIEIIGTSVLGEPISVIQIGSGSTKILMWSQMHGNESTTTKAIFDLCNVFAYENDSQIQLILKQCTIVIIPMLNPDGAKAYTRVNANDVDLNRDAQDISQPESRVLRDFFNKLQPHFCFNLHGQRTIFSAGNTNKSATVSFLAPAQDENCTITETRKKAMEIITVMNKNLQQQIPNQVGIYDDAFNINCVGDTFQSLNVPTILFEAGHFADDYPREKVREYIFQSLIIAIDYIANNTVTGEKFERYLQIPQNAKCFYDIIIRNARLETEVCEQITDIAIQYQERLVDNRIEFIPVVEQISKLETFFGHREIDAKSQNVVLEDFDENKVVNEIVFVLINNEKIALKPKIK